MSKPERPTGLIQRFKPIVTAALTATALVVSLISLFLSIQGERRSERQYEEQYSSRVFLSEGTSDRADPKTNKVNNYVYNASHSPIYDVWIQGQGDRVTRIGTIAICEMYELHTDFKPVTLYFKDAFGQWQREFATQKLSHMTSNKNVPAHGTDGTEYTGPIKNCS